MVMLVLLRPNSLALSGRPHALAPAIHAGPAAAGPSLPGRLVREGDRQHVPRVDPGDAEQVGDAVGDHARLAAASAREHETRTGPSVAVTASRWGGFRSCRTASDAMPVVVAHAEESTPVERHLP